jgi:hydroxymethylpyrimidine pyrophosphatase-like HAD family hydrolase
VCRAGGLSELRLEPAQTAGIGDAENDFAFLDLCGLPATVANAITSLKARVDYVTAGSRGAGVEEFIGRIMNGVLFTQPSRPSRAPAISHFCLSP